MIRWHIPIFHRLILYRFLKSIWIFNLGLLDGGCWKKCEIKKQNWVESKFVFYLLDKKMVMYCFAYGIAKYYDISFCDSVVMCIISPNYVTVFDFVHIYLSINSLVSEHYYLNHFWDNLSPSKTYRDLSRAARYVVGASSSQCIQVLGCGRQFKSACYFRTKP